MNIHSSDHDDSDPWANISKDRDDADADNDDGSDWVDSSRQQAKRQSADWVDFDEEHGQGDEDDEDGEEIPIRLSLEPGPDRGRVVHRDYTVDRSGSSGSEHSSDADSDGNGDGQDAGNKVKEASVRAAFD